jgi:hypothetical protein
MSSILIDSTYNGPPGSGNGGYCCGRFAAQLAADPQHGAQVTLRQPPPLDSPLDVLRTKDGVEIRSADMLVASAVPAAVDLQPLPAPEPQQAREAQLRYTGFADHPFAHCFVCGPERKVGDGLRLFPGALAHCSASVQPVACYWQPYTELGDEQGNLRPEFIWAALDCPTYFGAFAAEPNLVAVLGQQSVHCLQARLPASANYLIQSWLLETDGRKRHSAGALYTESGQCVALCRATWIVLQDAG